MGGKELCYPCSGVVVMRPISVQIAFSTSNSSSSSSSSSKGVYTLVEFN